MPANIPDDSFEVAYPGTPEHAAARRAMAEQTLAADAELLATDGADALTSDRLLRQAALVAEHDPELVAHAFGTWCQRRGWNRDDLAYWLGVSVDQLAALALERRGTERLAERYGADPDRLAAVLDR